MCAETAVPAAVSRTRTGSDDVRLALAAAFCQVNNIVLAAAHWHPVRVDAGEMTSQTVLEGGGLRRAPHRDHAARAEAAADAAQALVAVEDLVRVPDGPFRAVVDVDADDVVGASLPCQPRHHVSVDHVHPAVSPGRRGQMAQMGAVPADDLG